MSLDFFFQKVENYFRYRPVQVLKELVNNALDADKSCQRDPMGEVAMCSGRAYPVISIFRTYNRERPWAQVNIVSLYSGITEVGRELQATIEN